jgi:hypothetical protein
MPCSAENELASECLRKAPRKQSLQDHHKLPCRRNDSMCANDNSIGPMLTQIGSKSPIIGVLRTSCLTDVPIAAACWRARMLELGFLIGRFRGGYLPFKLFSLESCVNLLFWFTTLSRIFRGPLTLIYLSSLFLRITLCNNKKLLHLRFGRLLRNLMETLHELYSSFRSLFIADYY